ncbi:helix-turn-helix transcriptional regulator [Fulvivirgaceae bacterium PWU4]|uniref:Helix-turn-helix transcriptional regulator n=1 Tax=Chryseosolibacter histidini TaxID=2782349 RepID=A0AAP2GJI9_9BACT|nr:helix-turn-helix domain-containing protein [Chryseosolibacter histidini]MBT1698406.1 helix-turn-helix transcriptional regulator [Chryseosolibacter histidini]
MKTKKHVFPHQQCKTNFLALRDSLELLGGKWKLFIVLRIGKNPDDLHHFKKLEKDIIGISAKVLSKELRVLEENKIITRTVQNTRPVTVTYALTKYGQSLIPIAQDLQQWGLNHRKMISGI